MGNNEIAEDFLL